MIDWNTSKEDALIIGKIITRWQEIVKEQGVTVDRMSRMMDVEATHMDCPLKLSEFLEADEFNFTHDIIGIMDNIDRNTGKLKNCFVPRYAV